MTVAAASFADRVYETSSTMGAGGTVALLGAQTGFQSFSGAYGVGGKAAGIVRTDGTDWEVFDAVIAGSSSLTYGTCRASSNAGAAVDWGPGTRDVFVSTPGYLLSLILDPGFRGHAEATPAMTVRVDAGKIATQAGFTAVAAQSTGTITAPGVNPRIDRVVIDRATGAVSVITGTPAGSPTAPAITAGKAPICQVIVQTSSTAITDSMITDERVSAVAGYLPLAGGKLGGALEAKKGADVASATSCDIWTPADGNLVHVTGTTTIEDFATAPQAGAARLVVFTGALTLTNGATIILPGGANITTAAGDVALVIADTTTVARVIFQPIAGAGKVAQIATYETAASATGTTVLPTDDTKPQNDEGDQFMSLAFTPTNAASTLVIEVVFFGVHSGSTALSVALFKDSDADALAAVSAAIASNGATLPLTHKMVAGGTSAITFKVRAGGSVSGTTTINGIGGSRVFGGVASSSIVITEILP